MKSLFPIAQHYEETLPSENPGVKESEDRLQCTEARWAKMRFEALKRGYFITGQTKHYIDACQMHFQEKEFPKQENAPKLKMKDLIFNSFVMRLFRDNKEKTHS